MTADEKDILREDPSAAAESSGQTAASVEKSRRPAGAIKGVQPQTDDDIPDSGR